MSLFSKKDKSPYYPKVLVGASLLGLIASFWQAAERVHMLKYPAQELSCNISPVIDCSGVLNDKLAAVFGPPNALIGVVVFAMLLALGLQKLTGGNWTGFIKKLVLGLSLMIFLFSVWFFYVSLYILGKICVFCLFIWVSSMPIGLYGLKDYLETTKIKDNWLKQVSGFITKNHVNILVTMYALMVVLYIIRFSEYYFG